MIIKGYIRIGTGCDYSVLYIDDEPIEDIVEELITSTSDRNRMGSVSYCSEGLGEKDYFLKNCRMKIYYSARKCSLKELQSNMVSYLCGDIEGSGYYTGYSEYTITGFSIRSLYIGGHDLKKELASHNGEYIHWLIDEND